MVRWLKPVRASTVPAPCEQRPPPARTSPPGCRRSRSPASARCPTCPRRTTGSGATSPSTSGSRDGCAGLRVADLACGEGYGSDVLAATAAEVVGVDANPEAHEHARLRYRRPNLRFERGLVEEFDAGPCDAIVFLQTIEHIDDPGRAAASASRARRRVAYVSTPEPADARPAGRREVREPLAPARVHGRAEYRGAARAAFRARSRSSASSTPASCALHELALRARLGPRPPGAADHEAVLRPLRPGDLRRPTSPSGRRGRDLDRALDFLAVCRADERSRRPGRRPGDRPALATCPTWRASAPIRSARSGCSTRWSAPTCRCCEVAERRDDHGHARCSPTSSRRRASRSGCWRSCARYRLGAAERDVGDVEPSSAPRREAEADALPRARSTGSRRSAATCSRRSRTPARAGRVELIAVGRDPRGAAAASPPRGPPAADRRRAALASAPLRRPQRVLAARVRLRARARAAARRARPARTSAPTRARTSAPLDALAPVARRGRAGRLHDRLGGGASWCGRATAIPPTRATPSFTASRCAGRARGRSAASPTTRRRRPQRAREQAREFARRGRGAPRALPRRARRGRA